MGAEDHRFAYILYQARVGGEVYFAVWCFTESRDKYGKAEHTAHCVVVYNLDLVVVPETRAVQVAKVKGQPVSLTDITSTLVATATRDVAQIESHRDTYDVVLHDQHVQAVLRAATPATAGRVVGFFEVVRFKRSSKPVRASDVEKGRAAINTDANNKTSIRQQ